MLENSSMKGHALTSERAASRQCSTKTRTLASAFAIFVGGLSWACSDAEPASGSASALRVVRVERVFPHDASAFTQGLVFSEGSMYESTGLVGESSLRRVDLETGAVEQNLALDAAWFGEGLAIAGDRLVQLTWKHGIAVEYDLALAERRRFTYEGEGWGLCHDGARFVMSNGSDRLSFRDPTTFEELGGVLVRLGAEPLAALNELECVGDLVYANVWKTDRIVGIDPRSGQVRVDVDASGLLSAEEAAAADVLNGIARAELPGRFYVTGKLWPKLFEVSFVRP